MFCKLCGEQLKHKRLSPREIQLVDLLIEGNKYICIAALLKLSEGTVKVYISNLYKKVGCSGKFELLKMHYEGRLEPRHVCQTKEA